jgi:hypothetical protein
MLWGGSREHPRERVAYSSIGRLLQLSIAADHHYEFRA